MKIYNPVINSNTHNFCSPNRFAKSHINRINPDKSTFLNSNLIVSNILNHLEPNMIKEVQINDAYTNREIQLLHSYEQDKFTRQKIQRVRNLAKCRSQTSMDQRRSQEKDISQKIQQINVMKIQMNQKARDIMGRKEDTAYLGRNIFLKGQKFLMEMKDYNPSEKVVKIQATRMLMKESAKKKGRKNARISQTNIQQSQLMGNANNSVNMSMDASIDKLPKNSKNDQIRQKEKLLYQQIKEKSFDSVMNQQRRIASWRGFTQNWAMGFSKNDGIITTKKVRRAKRSPKRHLDTENDVEKTQILEYNDKYSRHQALKKYKSCFFETASSFNILNRY